MSNQEKPRSEISEDNGWRKQWARFEFWRKDGKKFTFVTTNAQILAIPAFCAICSALFLQTTPESNQSSAGNATPIPESAGTPQSGTVEIPRRESSQSNTAVQQNNAATQSQSHPQASERKKLWGPQVIIRPGLGKIPPGTQARALLTNGASNGPIRATIKESISLGGDTVIDSGTVLVGIGQSNDDRLTIQFTHLVGRDGTAESIQAQAIDPSDNAAGIRGSTVGTNISKLATGIGLNFVGGMSEGLQDSDMQTGFIYHRSSLKNALLKGASTAALEQARDMISSARSNKPIISVPAGTIITVIFN